LTRVEETEEGGAAGGKKVRDRLGNGKKKRGMGIFLTRESKRNLGGDTGSKGRGRDYSASEKGEKVAPT